MMSDDDTRSDFVETVVPEVEVKPVCDEVSVMENGEVW